MACTKFCQLKHNKKAIHITWCAMVICNVKYPVNRLIFEVF